MPSLHVEPRRFCPEWAPFSSSVQNCKRCSHSSLSQQTFIGLCHVTTTTTTTTVATAATLHCIFLLHKASGGWKSNISTPKMMRLNSFDRISRTMSKKNCRRRRRGIDSWVQPAHTDQSSLLCLMCEILQRLLLLHRRHSRRRRH